MPSPRTYAPTGRHPCRDLALECPGWSASTVPISHENRDVTARAIGDYGLLSDCHSAALVSGDGSVDWLCWPRFDSPSVFGRLLDDSAGHWSIRPAEEYDVRRRYLEDTLVLETQFTTSSGMGMLTDALVLDGDERGHDIGRHAPRVLVRSIEVSEGVMSFSAEFQPKPEYGVVEPRLELKDQTLLSHGGAVLLALSGPPPNELGRSVATWFVTLAAGEATCFALEYRHRERTSDVHQWSGRQSRRALAGTVKAWRSWSELHQRYEGPAKALVHHSGRVLQALTYQPTGAIVAAPTTSLGEVVGGSRNWDYRYGWIRDASMTMRALWIAACPDEAGRFLRWIVETVGAGGGKRPALQIMYGVGGEHDLSERELTHLEGWRQSRPVRVGNGAWNQIQHDIYGELLDAVLTLHEQLGPPDAATRSFLLEVADASAMVWEEPDAGIWEGRGSPKHHLYSKLMCWVALDRAIQLADWLGATDRVPGWEAVRTAIRAAILDQGWNEDLQCFTQCFGGRDLDASSLMLAISGFLPVDDTRMASTISKVGTALAAPCGLLYRYSGDDGVGGEEGVFLLCSYWMVECLAALGDADGAFELFERATAYANDLGLLSEEADPRQGELVGNFPQAFSHIGLVNAAWALARMSRP